MARVIAFEVKPICCKLIAAIVVKVVGFSALLKKVVATGQFFMATSAVI